MSPDDKILVVVAVVLVIFTGLILYLVSIDCKLRKIEKELEDQNQPES